jgi:glycerol-3-phosphate dehydrogenase
VAEIRRDPAAEAAREFDLVVIGGGIYGAALLLEASYRGLRALLLERGDFGEGTTRNCLRIVHGGLRYLQGLDLRRHRESVAERGWLLRNFPELVVPLPCLMPLYGRGARRPGVMRLALGIDELLSPDRNRGVEPARQLARGRLSPPERVEELLPGVRRAGLRGGATWSDAIVPELPRLLMEFLHRACERGASALNYVEATGLLREQGRVQGVRACDRTTGADRAYRAHTVINAAGPGCRALAGCWDRDHPELFEPTVAWNVLLDVAPPFARALAVAPPGAGRRTYFLIPWQGRLLAGTGHDAATEAASRPRVAGHQLASFLGDLDEAVPDLGICKAQLLRIYAGYLPGRRFGTADLATRPVILDHAASGGPSGLWSVSGVKFTTARRVADATLRRAFPKHRRSDPLREQRTHGPQQRAARTRFGPAWRPDADGSWKDELRLLIAEESVQHLDDLMLRRTSLGDDPRTAREVATRVCEVFDWDASHRDLELQRLERCLDDATATSE